MNNTRTIQLLRITLISSLFGYFFAQAAPKKISASCPDSHTMQARILQQELDSLGHLELITRDMEHAGSCTVFDRLTLQQTLAQDQIIEAFYNNNSRLQAIFTILESLPDFKEIFFFDLSLLVPKKLSYNGDIVNITFTGNLEDFKPETLEQAMLLPLRIWGQIWQIPCNDYVTSILSSAPCDVQMFILKHTTIEVT